MRARRLQYLQQGTVWPSAVLRWQTVRLHIHILNSSVHRCIKASAGQKQHADLCIGANTARYTFWFEQLATIRWFCVAFVYVSMLPTQPGYSWHRKVKDDCVGIRWEEYSCFVGQGTAIFSPQWEQIASHHAAVGACCPCMNVTRTALSVPFHQLHWPSLGTCKWNEAVWNISDCLLNWFSGCLLSLLPCVESVQHFLTPPVWHLHTLPLHTGPVYCVLSF